MIAEDKQTLNVQELIRMLWICFCNNLPLVIIDVRNLFCCLFTDRQEHAYLNEKTIFNSRSLSRRKYDIRVDLAPQKKLAGGLWIWMASSKRHIISRQSVFLTNKMSESTKRLSPRRLDTTKTWCETAGEGLLVVAYRKLYEQVHRKINVKIKFVKRNLNLKITKTIKCHIK